MGFFLSQLYCKNKQINTTYSIGLGLVFYSAFYLYFLFYNNELLPFFNNILIYIVGIDLLLTTFYSYKVDDTEQFEDNYELQQDLPDELPEEDLQEELHEDLTEDLTETLPNELQEELTEELTEESLQLTDDFQEELTEELLQLQEDDVSDIIEMETITAEEEIIDDSLSTMYKEFEEESTIKKRGRPSKKKVIFTD